MDKQFDEMDTDHDGTLSKEEMLKYRGLMMKEHATKDSKE
jgi:Ca2+-binding EF-hand superfamily protein